MPPLLEQEFDLDYRVQPYYRYFIDLCEYRKIQAGLGGVVYEALTPEQVIAWMRLEHQDIGVFGWELIKSLDRTFRELQAEKMAAKKVTGKPKLRGRI